MRTHAESRVRALKSGDRSIPLPLPESCLFQVPSVVVPNYELTVGHPKPVVTPLLVWHTNSVAADRHLNVVLVHYFEPHCDWHGQRLQDYSLYTDARL